MVPRSLFGRALAVLWSTVAASLLVFAYVQREIHDMPVAFTWLLIYLTLPVGLVIIPAWSFLADALPIPRTDLWQVSLLWLIAVPFAYAQWFIALPWLYRRAGSPAAQTRVIVITVALGGSFIWGLNDLLDGRLLPFGIRIAVVCTLAIAALVWASKGNDAYQRPE